MSKKRGVKNYKDQLEHRYPIWMIMKLRNPFSVIKSAFSDIEKMHDFSYTVPTETRDEFWNKECIKYPTSSTCKVYED